MSRDQSPKSLSATMRRLSRFYGIDIFSKGAYPDGQRYHRIELVAHEVAHGVVLGLNLNERQLSNTVADMHSMALKYRRSDDLEVQTCAVEMLALRALGVPVTAMRLAATAIEMAKFYKREATILRGIERAARRPSVQRRAGEMVTFVRREMRK